MLLCIIAGISMKATSQVVQAEYFFDTDPGVGNGTALLAEDGSFDNAIEALFKNGINAGSLSVGMHTFNVRVKDGNNTWGPVFKTIVNVTSTFAYRSVQVSQAELFWDTDPGVGNGTAMVAFDGNFDDAIETLLKSLSPPSVGNHVLHVRVKDGNNTWGPTFKTVVEVTNNLTLRPLNISSGELFWDTDPGVGNGTAMVAFDGNFDDALETVSKSLSTPTTGLHVLHIRVKDANNTWGPTFKYVVDVTNPLTLRNARISEAELFWDTDPGVGNGIPMLAFDGNFNDAIEEAIKNPLPITVSAGHHVLHVRVKDHQGNWGQPFKYIIHVTPPFTYRNLNIVSGELFWDTDPGQGNGTPLIAFDGNYDDAIETALANIPAPTVGNHVLHVRVKDSTNTWGPTFKTVVQVSTPFSYRTIKIDLAEMFWDTDPGAGNGIPMIAFDGNYDNAIEEVLKSTTPPSLGNHVLHVRVRDGQGTWGPTFRYITNVTNPFNYRNILVKKGEFFFDTDPGYGLGFPLLAFDGNFDQAIEDLSQSWNFFPDTGFHVLNFRVQDANNQWGPVFRTVLKVLPCANPPTVSITPNTTQQICPGDTVTFTATSGFASYTWFRGGTIVGTGQTYDADTMGFYRVYAVDGNGCGAFSPFTQVNQIPVNVNITANGPLTFCQGGNVTLNAGSGFNSYLWSTGSSSQYLTVATSGQYIVTVTNGACFGYDTVNVVVHPLPTTPVITSSGPTTFCAGGSVYLYANSSASNYYWNTFETNDTILVSNAGVYTVTVTDNNGCTKSNSVTIGHYPAPITTYSNTTSICVGDTAQLFVNGSGVSYQWSPLGHITNPTISSPKVFPPVSTQYKVIVTGVGGCVDSAFVQVNVNPKPTVTASTNAPTCVGQTLMLFANPNGAGSYSWSGPAGFTSTIQNPVINNITLINNGMYIVTATNPGGCYAKDTVIVSGINATPVISLNGNFNLCQGDTLQFNLLPSGMTYQWTGPNGFTSTMQNPQINNVTPADAGNYMVVVTNSSNCSASTQATVSVDTQPNLSLSGSNQVCQGNAISITTLPNGLSSYQWTGPNGYTSTNQHVLITNAQNTNSGWYVLHTGNGGNCSSKDSIYVTVNPVPVAQILNTTDSLCAGHSIQWLAGPSGMQSYLWQGPNGYISTQQNPIIPYLQTYHSGNYVLIVTNSFGCTDNASFNLTVNPIPVPNATTNAPYVCEGDTLLLFANPSGMTYQWSSNTGFTSTSQNPVIDSAVVANTGTYFVTVTNAFGCSATAQTDVFVSANPDISFVNNTVFCEGETLQLFASPSGMASYQWMGPDNFSSPLNNPSVPQITLAGQGYYVLNIMNNYGCTDVDSIYIQVNPRPVVTASGNGTLCDGDSLLLQASPGGLSSYVWTGPNGFGANIQNPVLHNVTELSEGSYVVTVTNSYGCTDSDIFYVSVNQGPTISVSYLSPLCEGDTLAFNTIPSGMISYQWTGPNGFSSTSEDPVIPNVTEDNSGVYTVVVSNGLCSSTKTSTVLVNSMPNTTVTQVGTVMTALQGGAAYQWLDCVNNNPLLGETNQTFTAQYNGSFAVVVIMNGCIDTSACYQVVGLGMFEEEMSTQWEIYPNPNEGIFNIKANKEAVYELMDMQGKVLQVIQANDYPHEVKTLLPAGMYFIREQKTGEVQKVIIK